MDTALIVQFIPALAILIAIIAFFLSYRNFQKFGSILGRSYDFIILMMAVATVGFILHAFVQTGLLEDNLVTQLLSEATFVFEAILLGVASWTAKKHFEDLFSDTKDDSVEARERRLKEVEDEEDIADAKKRDRQEEKDGE